jgi:hypothetical protein
MAKVKVVSPKAIPIPKSKISLQPSEICLQENAKPGNLFIPSHRYPSP